MGVAVSFSTANCPLLVVQFRYNDPKAKNFNLYFFIFQLTEVERWFPVIVYADVWDWYSPVLLLRSSSVLEILICSTLCPLSPPIHWTILDP